MVCRKKLLILTAVSIAARLVLLGSKSFWIDECLAWGAVRLPWGDMVRSVAAGTPHPPLSFLIMKLSTLIAGTGHFGMRFLTALAVASAVVPVYTLAARRSTEKGGFFAGLLWALSPFAVSLGQEAWVYGLTAALTLWFADVADRAWRGSRTAYVILFPLGALGLLSGQIFVLSVVVASILYLSVPKEERIPFSRFLPVPAGLALAYLPMFLYFSAQFTARNQRMAAAGMHMGFSRLLSPSSVSAYLRILQGGMIPELTRNLLERPRMIAVYAVNAAAVFSLGVLPLFRWRKWGFRSGGFLWAAVLIPFALFLNDSPGIRQLSVLWVPLSITSGMFFSRVRFSGVAAAVLCGVLLVPYYALKEFPCHRSNWRNAVALVECRGGGNDAVVLLGGKSTSLVWECYSGTSMAFYAPGGMNPFAPESERTRVDVSEIIADIIATGGYDRLWIINDAWGLHLNDMFPGEIEIITDADVGSDMEIGCIPASGHP